MELTHPIRKLKARNPAVLYMLVGFIMTAIRYDDILNYNLLDIYQKGFMYFWIIFTIVGVYMFFATILEIGPDYFIAKGHIKKLDRKIVVDQMTKIELDSKKIMVSFKGSCGYEPPIKIQLHSFFEQDKAFIVETFQKWETQLLFKQQSN